MESTGRLFLEEAGGKNHECQVRRRNYKKEMPSGRERGCQNTPSRCRKKAEVERSVYDGLSGAKTIDIERKKKKDAINKCLEGLGIKKGAG